MQPEVTVIIVSWNVREKLRQCLEHVADSQGVKLFPIVIDNASQDGSAEMVQYDFPKVALITNQTNRGFAAALNQGIERAQPHTHLLLLNPDLVLEPDTIVELCKALDRTPSAGIVGGQLHYPNGAIQPSVKRFPRWIDLFLVLTKLQNFFPKLTKSYNGLDVDYTAEQIVDQVMGSLFLIRRKTLEAVGTFDQGFWIWFEEVDFCKRAKDKGWQTLYTPHARAVHERGASFQQQSSRIKQRELRKSISHYARKHFGLIPMIALFPGMVVSIASAVLIDLLNIKKPAKARDL